MFLLKITGFLCTFLLMLTSLAVSQDLGKVEWRPEGPVVVTKGIGAVNPQMPLAVQRPSVIEAAKVVGLRNVLQIIKGVNINSEATVEDRMLTNDIIITSTEGMIKEFRVGEPEYYSDGTVEIEIEVPIYRNPDLMKNLLPMEKIGSKDADVVKSSGRPVIYSGLIINSKDLGLLPALTLEIKDQSGNSVYSPDIIKTEYLFSMEGMVSYVANMKQAKDMTERVGNKPLIITAVNSSGKNKTDLIISNEDAEKILAAKENINWLKECRVIIITNSF